MVFLIHQPFSLLEKDPSIILQTEPFEMSSTTTTHLCLRIHREENSNHRCECVLFKSTKDSKFILHLYTFMGHQFKSPCFLRSIATLRKESLCSTADIKSMNTVALKSISFVCIGCQKFKTTTSL